MLAEIGMPAPKLKISKWVKGPATNINKLKGKVILVEVFQVNCPGCFIYALPEALSFYGRYKNLKIIGLATAFEDFEINNLENLKKLIKTREVFGETQKVLQGIGLLSGGKLSYEIPFPVAMDSVTGETPETFTAYRLSGTPSKILIDKKGILRKTIFGQDERLEGLVLNLLKE
jgi:hypothetical protein